MPATVHVTRAQIETLYEQYEGDVIFQEMPKTDNDIEAWVLDGSHDDDSHRSVILDKDGQVLGDTVLKD